MNKNIKKVYQCGGGIDTKIVNYIAINFWDGETAYIENNLVDSVKKQVNNYIKKQNDNTKR